MIWWLLILVLPVGAEGYQEYPLAQFKKGGDCVLTAHQLSTHPKNQDKAFFYCQEVSSS